MRRVAALIALSLAPLAGCMSDRPETNAGQGQVVLVVRPATDVDTAELVPAANELAKLPGVLDVTASVGRSAATSRPSERDVVFVLTYKPDAAGVGGTDWPATLSTAGFAGKVADVAAYPGTLQNYSVGTTFSAENTAAAVQRRAAALDQQKNLRQQAK